ncbi:hypothetical protein BMY_0826 [Wohlfahrtiimonas chitiniclastica]|nr:hypothetical protein BMY_0826 [Wohlfahrtiimonas chitiniclastica]
MIIKPKIRGFICTTAHPTGCDAHVKAQIDYIRAKGPLKDGPKRVLVIGASTGYGLASRIEAAFGSDAATIGVFLRNLAQKRKQAPPAGITQRRLINMPKQQVYTQKASMAMPSQTKCAQK